MIHNMYQSQAFNIVCLVLWGTHLSNIVLLHRRGSLAGSSGCTGLILSISRYLFCSCTCVTHCQDTASGSQMPCTLNIGAATKHTRVNCRIINLVPTKHPPACLVGLSSCLMSVM